MPKFMVVQHFLDTFYSFRTMAPVNIQALFPDTTSTISQSQTAHYNTRSSKAPAKIFQSPCLRLERSKKQAVYVGPNLYNYIVPIANSFINEYNTSNKQRHHFLLAIYLSFEYLLSCIFTVCTPISEEYT